MSFQTIIVVGYVGKDAEMRFTPQGTNVTNFSVAVSEKKTNADGTKYDETIWFRISAWGKLGETCNQYVKKGNQVLVEGKLKGDPKTGGPRIWDGQSGPGSSFEITAANVRFLNSKNGNSGNGSNNNGGSANVDDADSEYLAFMGGSDAPPF